MQGLGQSPHAEINATFPPPRQKGLVVDFTLAALFLCGAIYAFLQAEQSKASGGFLAYFLIAILLFIPAPVLSFQAYALLRAAYHLERDGMRLRWGWRTEDIPLNEIEWIRPAADLVTMLPLPWPRWPGSLRGTRQVEGLGPIEFMASNLDHLLLIATPLRIYAISPADPKAFLRMFNTITEMGSLAPLQPKSVYPKFVIQDLLEDPLASRLLAAAMVLTLGLLAWVAILIPSHPTLPLGFYSTGDPEPSSPGAQLLLLPFLSGLNLFFDFAVGIYFYRRVEKRFLAYLLWGTAAFTALLLIMGVFFIIRHA